MRRVKSVKYAVILTFEIIPISFKMTILIRYCSQKGLIDINIQLFIGHPISFTCKYETTNQETIIFT